jgi:hypothetical protein
MLSKLFRPLFSGHYSKATLKTYTGWVRKFQAFTKSKDAGLLTVDDVKNFVTLQQHPTESALTSAHDQAGEHSVTIVIQPACTHLEHC